jgi:2,3-diphosphopglycerate-independent phosphoglycerate mutase
VNALSDALRKALTEHQINRDRIQNGKNPANVILLRGPGMRLNVQTFAQLHNINAFLIAPTAIIAGLGISVGLPVIKVEGATGDMDSNFNVKAQKAAELLRGDEYDMGIIHMKGIDDASHDGNPEKKMELIERADSAIRLLIEKLSAWEIETGEHFIIGVVADHSTSSAWMDHTFEPVPVCFSEVCSIAKAIGVPHKDFDARYIESDSIERYTEVDACRGSLGRFCGAKLMELMFHYAGRDGISH